MILKISSGAVHLPMLPGIGVYDRWGRSDTGGFHLVSKGGHVTNRVLAAGAPQTPDSVKR